MKRTAIIFILLLAAACSPSVQVAQSSGPLPPPNSRGSTVAPTGTPAGTAAESSPNVSAPAPSATATPSAVLTSVPAFHIRAAFYYPWFPEAWKQQGFDPFTNYNPSLGFYDSSAPATIQSHLQALAYGNFQAAILSWWGQGSPTDGRVPAFLAAIPTSSDPNFRIALYYENESVGDPSVSQLESDLAYIRDHYSINPGYLKIDGKFVLFAYAGANDGCGMVDRWVQANDALGHPAYVVLKVFSGYHSCASQPDSWHQYAPAGAVKEEKGYSITISPGFWKKGEAAPRLARDLASWAASVRAMLASNEPWQLVTTFNEWGEGTAIESAQQWASPSGFGAYLDVLHANGANNATK